MKKIKYLLIVVFLIILGIIIFNGKSVDDRVKVYVFEAGGCPYCEKEIAYLQSLDSYERDFVIVRKELYIDHIDWEEGKDYELGKTVAEEFIERGFEDASYEGTPFVVISNLYAETSYNTDLEAIIKEAYKEGDTDTVGCIANSGNNCFDAKEKKETNSDKIKTVILVIFVAALLSYIITSSKNSEEGNIVEERDYEKDTKEKIEYKTTNSKSKKPKKGKKK